MKPIAERTPTLLRCVKCHCAQEMPSDGVCLACGFSAWPRQWEEETRRHAIQPEERSGCVCPDCGEPVTVRMPLRPLVQSPLLLWTVFGVVFAGLAVLVSAPWSVLLWLAAPAVLVLPLHLLYRRHGGAASLKTIVVLCRTCGFVRIGGQTMESLTAPFRRGARMFDGLYHKLLPAWGFFLVVMVGALATDTVPTAANIALCVITGFAFHAIRWYRGAFGLRGWW